MASRHAVLRAGPEIQRLPAYHKSSDAMGTVARRQRLRSERRFRMDRRRPRNTAGATDRPHRSAQLILSEVRAQRWDMRSQPMQQGRLGSIRLICTASAGIVESVGNCRPLASALGKKHPRSVLQMSGGSLHSELAGGPMQAARDTFEVVCRVYASDEYGIDLLAANSGYMDRRARKRWTQTTSWAQRALGLLIAQTRCAEV